MTTKRLSQHATGLTRPEVANQQQQKKNFGQNASGGEGISHSMSVDNALKREIFWSYYQFKD